MDAVTKANLVQFVSANDIHGTIEEQFEKFVSYCILAEILDDALDLESVGTSGGDDCAMDSIAIVANGSLITEVGEVQDVINSNRYLDVQFYFIQATVSEQFESAKINTFFFGVEDFFSESPRLPANEKVSVARSIKAEIYKNAAYFKKGNPDIYCYYCTTGTWRDKEHAGAIIDAFASRVESTNLIEKISISMIGAREIQQLYRSTQNSLKVEINLPLAITLPLIDDVDQSYLAIISGPEYLKLIRDEHGNIRKSVFYDNVRDYQGDNRVNKKISETLTSGNKSAFAIRNNGVTVVTKNLTRTGNSFALTDFQIVNGCQTSHVLYLNADLIDEAVSIPIRIVATNNEDVIRSVIAATNSQTEVSDEQLHSLSDFQKLLEDHYSTYNGDLRLYYERRSKQYASEPGVEKTRIISIPSQIKSYCAVFLNDPHRAGRYYATLRKIHEGNLFRDEHKPEPYFVSSLMAYKLEFLFRNNLLDTKYKAARWHILLAARALCVHQVDVPVANSRRMGEFCSRIIKSMSDAEDFTVTFQLAASIVENAFSKGAKSLQRDDARDQESTDLVLSELRRTIQVSV